MPAPLSHRNTKLFVVGFLLALVAFIVVATILITGGMNDEELQQRVREAREAQEAGLDDSDDGIEDPGARRPRRPPRPRRRVASGARGEHCGSAGYSPASLPFGRKAVPLIQGDNARSEPSNPRSSTVQKTFAADCPP